MAANSYTGTVDTQGEWVTVASATGFNFVTDNTYTMQVQNGAYIKISSAVFYVSNEKFTYKATSDALYIRTNGSIVLTILENA